MSENDMVWRGEAGRYEVWYATLTHRESGDGFWIRYTLESPTGGHKEAAPYAALWFARGSRGAGTFGIHKRYPIAALTTGRDPFRLEIGPGLIEDDRRQGRMTGALGGGGHEVRWDLRFRSAPIVHRHLPDFAYWRGGRLVDTAVLSPNLSVGISGSITVDGRVYECDQEPGGQSHLWGRKHAYAWAWAHCNAFETGPAAAEAVLEALTVQLRRGPMVLPRLTMVSVYPEGLGGEVLAFRDVTQLLSNRSAQQPAQYHLVAEGGLSRVEATLTTRQEDLVLTEYEDPDGEPAYCHNTVIGGCELVIHRRRRHFPVVGAAAGWSEWRRLRTEGRAHWEWGARAGDSRVKQRHVDLG